MYRIAPTIVDPVRIIMMYSYTLALFNSILTVHRWKAPAHENLMVHSNFHCTHSSESYTEKRYLLNWTGQKRHGLVKYYCKHSIHFALSSFTLLQPHSIHFISLRSTFITALISFRTVSLFLKVSRESRDVMCGG